MGLASRLTLTLAFLSVAATGAEGAGEVSAEPVVQTGHVKFLSDIAISADGALLATAGWEKSVKVWELDTGRLRRTINHGMSWGESLSFHPENRMLAVGGRENEIQVFDLATGDSIGRWKVPTRMVIAPVEVTFSPDGRWLFSFHKADSSLHAWRTGTFEAVLPAESPHSLRDPSPLSLPGSSYVVTRRIAGGFRAFHAEGGPPSATGLLGQRAGKWLVAQRRDTRCEIVAWPETTALGTLPASFGSCLNLRLSPDGRHLAMLEEKSVRLFDMDTWKEVGFVISPSDRPGIMNSKVRQLAWTGDGRSLLTLYGDASVQSWDSATGRPLHSFSPRVSPAIALKISGDGRWLAVGHHTEAENWKTVVSLWDLRGGALLRRVDLGANKDPAGLAFDRAGATLFVGAAPGVFAVEANGGGLKANLAGFGGKLSHAAAADLLAAQNQKAERGGSAVFDLAKRKLVAEGPEWVHALALSPDGNLLATAELNVQHVSLWETMMGKLLLDLPCQPGHTIEQLAFSPDGRWLASASDTASVVQPFVELKIWNPSNGRLHRAIRIDSQWVRALIFSPDSRLVTAATLKYRGGFIAEIRIQSFDVETGQRKLDFDTRLESLTALEVSPDGRWFLSANEEGTVRLWDAKTGAEKALLVHMPGAQDWAVVAPDGLFDGSPAGIQKLVAWRFGGEQTAPLEAFFNEFYYPGLLAEILTGASLPAPAQIGSLDRRQPSVRLSFVEPKGANGASTRTATVRVDVGEAAAGEGHAVGSGARDVRLFRNGSLVKIWRGDVLTGGAASAAIEAMIPLVAGENRLTAYAFNRANIKSADATLTLTGDESLRREGTLYVVTIGIDGYANPEYNLRFATADAKAFGEELKKRQVALGSFGRVILVPLFDESATKANILGVIARLAGGAAKSGALPGAAAKVETAVPEDSVVLFFAGHGTASGNRFYILPHDLGYDGERTSLTAQARESIRAHAISDLELERALEGVDARQIVLVIDACNSGQALEAEEKRRGPMNSKGLAQLAWEKGMVILTAAQSYQAALEAAQLGHGYLTFALVEEGLNSAAPDTEPADGVVMLREWFDYAASRVPQLQFEQMKSAHALSREVAFVEGEEAIREIERRSLQRPRVFHRREAEVFPMVIRRLEAAQ